MSQVILRTNVENCKLIALQLDNIPVELQTLDQWVGTKVFLKDGKWKKPPFVPNTPDRNASKLEPGDWGSFSRVKNLVERGVFTAPAFCFTGSDPFTLLDIDGIDAWDDPKLKQILGDYSDAYIEKSISGNGLHIVFRGPEKPAENKGANGTTYYGGVKVECKRVNGNRSPPLEILTENQYRIHSADACQLAQLIRIGWGTGSL
jgi:hypothetical protein